MKFTSINNPTPKKATDEELIAAYSELKSIWKVAEKFNMGGQTVHERLKKLNINCDGNGKKFTEQDDERLKRDYIIYRNSERLKELAAEMGWPLNSLCVRAKKLGLTNYSHPRLKYGKWKHMTEETARILFEDFKKSSFTMGAYCKNRGYDDLGFSRTMRQFFPDEWDFVIEGKAPAQTLYRIGRAFEYRIRDILRGKGYFVMRSPRSGSPIDLVAIIKGKVLFIQCKRYGVLGVKEWNELFELAKSVDAIPLLAEQIIPRGYRLWKLTDKKDGTKRLQPRIEYTEI
ncbi:MAG: hypothetical protein PHN89_04440 [Candidatus Pacebacteria bacterium]|nr:hypothetical protein [Candidatus Paceibacterota bacterium]